MVLIALAAAALAEEPDTSRDVIVYGELLVQQAREEVVAVLKAEGYTIEIDKGDHVVYRNPSAWRGDVELYDDGFMIVKRQPLHFEGAEMPWAERNSAVAWAGCVLYPWLCMRGGGQVVGERKWRAVESRTVASAAVEVRTWGERVADLHTDERVSALPDQLAALWDHGLPLEPGPPLATVAERKAAILAFWASRTDSPWGEEVRAAVEAFLRAVVQHSDTPITPDELRAFNAVSPASRPLRLGPSAE